MFVTISRGRFRTVQTHLYLRPTTLSSQLTLDLHVQWSASFHFNWRALCYMSLAGNSERDQVPLQSEPSVLF